MKVRALVVPRERGEAVRRALAESGRLRHDVEIVERGGMLWLPVDGDGAIPDAWGRVEEAELPDLDAPGPRDYRELVDLPPPARALLPRSFDVVGDVVLVRLPKELLAYGPEIGRALLAFVPRARLVGADHGVHGPERRRRLERLAGQGPWATVHRENQLALDVDPERAYFSPRLAGEHARVAREVRTGDRVYDLCCGVGPFAVHVARDGRAREIVAVDANPAAIALLRRTLARYPFGARVEPVEGRIEAFGAARPAAERAILNLPHEGIKYAPSVARLVAPGGRLYYYEIVPRSEFDRRGSEVAAQLEPSGAWRSVEVRVVHPYAPESDLVSMTFDRATG